MNNSCRNARVRMLKRSCRLKEKKKEKKIMMKINEKYIYRTFREHLTGSTDISYVSMLTTVGTGSINVVTGFIV